MLYFEQSSQRRFGFLSTVAVIAVLTAGSASSQALRNAAGPAEIPPGSYTANQFIDSSGCVFVRAGIGGTTQWVPRVSRSREQLCGFEPTRLPGSPAPAVTPQERPTQVVTAPPAAPAPAPVPETAPAPVIVAAAPAPAPAPAPTPEIAATPTQVSAPAPTVVRTPPAQDPVVTPAAPSPRVIAAPDPAPTRLVLTRAQACEGLTGVQPQLIGQRSGRPIDCGGTPAPRVVAAAATSPTTTPRPETRSETRARLSRAQACADSAATGRQYVSTTTGLPLACATDPAQIATGTNPFERLQADLALPPRPYVNPLDAAPGAVFATGLRPNIASTSPRRYTNPLDAPPGATTFIRPANTITVTRARTSPSTQTVFGQIFNQNPPPYSNPTNTAALAAPTVPQGFQRVWNDGRLNTQRGLPRAETAQPTVRYATTPRAQTVEQPRVSTRTAPQTAPRVEQISGHRYVQVGTFSTRDQAQSIAQALRARGLPMRIGVFNQNGQDMRIVLAGPFSNDRQLQGALGTARGAGFSGAFTRQ